MECSEAFIKTTDGLTLLTREWKTENEPTGIVCLVHGLGEHCGRYFHVAEALNRAGFILLSFDLRGHGKSQGKKGHTPSYEMLMDDIGIFLKNAAERYPGLPCFLYGQSLGGNLVLNYALRRKPRLSGVIAASPWLRLAFEPPAFKMMLGMLMSRIYPSFTQSNTLKPGDLSHNPEVGREYSNSDLDHDKISAGMFTSVYKAGIWAVEHAGEFSLPLLLMHGTGDRITSHEASTEFAEALPGLCTLKLWEGLYHELHNEPQSREILNYMTEWMKGKKECSYAQDN